MARHKARMPVVMAIGGSDSSSGAGIQADLKTFQDFHVYGVCAVTAVTAQSSIGVSDIMPIPPDSIAQQIRALTRDCRVDAAKTGMLHNPETVQAVAHLLAEAAVTALVVDPVLTSHLGTPLSQEGLREALIEKLIPMASVVTPNKTEAGALCGGEVTTLAQAEEAASYLCEMGAQASVVTGVELAEGMVDVYCDRKQVGHLTLPKLEKAVVHGTGCAFSAALVACLASGRTFKDSLEKAKQYTYASISNAVRLGPGQLMSGHGCDII